MTSNEASFYGQTEAPAEAQSEGSQFREQGDSGNQSFAIELVPGYRCQLNCGPCFKSTMQCTGAENEMPTLEVEDYVRQACEEGFQEIVIIGGEPTLHRDVYRIIRHVRGLGLSPILCTNGYPFAKEEKAKELEGTGTTVVTHAYFPGGDEVIDEFSGKEGYAQTLKKAIDNLKQVEDVTLVMEMPLTDLMYPHAFDFFKHCRETDVIPFIEISRSRDNGAPTTNVTPEQVAELFEKMRQFDEANYPDLADKVITPPAYGNKCTMTKTGLHVKNFATSEHGVYSCCAQGVSHGDLRKQSLKEIMRSSTLAIFRDQDRYIVGPCVDCEEYDICQGGCRGEAYLKFGCPRASSPSCHLIPEEVRNDRSIMAPENCDGCPAEDCGNCSLEEEPVEFNVLRNERAYAQH